MVTAGCLKDAVKSFSELQALENALTNKFGDEVSTHITNGLTYRMVTAAFINSPLNDSSKPERTKRADETAQIIHAHYANSTGVNSIYIVFVRRVTAFAVFHETRTVDTYGYDLAGQQLRSHNPYLPVPSPDTEITAAYAATEGTTDISTYRIFQLDGEPGGYGITVMPHFKLQGDARTRRAPAPEEISFYFASYSKKPRFTKLVPFEFIADGTPVMQGEADFTGSDAQYCSLNVSYSDFRKFIAGKDLAIKLGAKEYPLTPEQLAILQKMDAYVRQ